MKKIIFNIVKTHVVMSTINLQKFKLKLHNCELSQTLSVLLYAPVSTLTPSIIQRPSKASVTGSRPSKICMVIFLSNALAYLLKWVPVLYLPLWQLTACHGHIHGVSNVWTVDVPICQVVTPKWAVYTLLNQSIHPLTKFSYQNWAVYKLLNRSAPIW
jgi:hypothetical protein